MLFVSSGLYTYSHTHTFAELNKSLWILPSGCILTRDRIGFNTEDYPEFTMGKAQAAVWFGEGNGNRVRLHMVQAILGWARLGKTIEQVRADYDLGQMLAEREATEQGQSASKGFKGQHAREGSHTCHMYDDQVMMSVPGNPYGVANVLPMECTFCCAPGHLFLESQRSNGLRRQCPGGDKCSHHPVACINAGALTDPMRATISSRARLLALQRRLKAVKATAKSANK
jgi:hypothetical protein